MNFGTTLCFALSGMFLLFSIIFALSKEKGTILLAGFNTFPKWKRENYDRLKMSKDMRNKFFSWFLLFLVGGTLSHFLSTYIGVVVFILWLILFFLKDFNIDVEKAFSKYKL